MTALKAGLRQGGSAAVLNPDFPTAGMIEFSASLGFDAVFIDCEHGSADFTTVEEFARAARAAGIASIVRPWTAEPALINRYLSCGVDGIQVPHVDDRAQAAAVLAGLAEWEGDYRQKLLLMMIESETAIANLSDLLTVPDVDVFYFGAFDLALSMGLKGQNNHPRVKAALEAAIRQVAAAGRTAGMNVQDNVDDVRTYRSMGLRWINVHLKALLRRGTTPFMQSVRA